jgi:hypothetical protein
MACACRYDPVVFPASCAVAGCGPALVGLSHPQLPCDVSSAELGTEIDLCAVIYQPRTPCAQAQPPPRSPRFRGAWDADPLLLSGYKSWHAPASLVSAEQQRRRRPRTADGAPPWDRASASAGTSRFAPTPSLELLEGSRSSATRKPRRVPPEFHTGAPPAALNREAPWTGGLLVWRLKLRGEIGLGHRQFRVGRANLGYGAWEDRISRAPMNRSPCGGLLAVSQR